MQLIDHYSPNWRDQTHASVQRWLAHEQHPYVYLLLDAAFRHDTSLALIRRLFPTTSYCSLFQDSPNASESVIASSPLLIAIDSSSLGILGPIVEETTGQPMLSLIVTPEPMDALQKRLCHFLMVTLHETRYLLRLTDTRRLPEILAMLNTEQRLQLTGQMLAWHYVGRDAHWHALQLPPHAGQRPQTLTPVTLSEDQAMTLIDMNRIDALIDGLRRNEPELHAGFATPYQRYRWIESVLAESTDPTDTYPQQVECCRAAARREGWL